MTGIALPDGPDGRVPNEPGCTWAGRMAHECDRRGAGLAGMRRAGGREGRADVILIDRGPIGMGTNSACRMRRFRADLAGARRRIRRSGLQIGKRLNRVAYVRKVAAEHQRWSRPRVARLGRRAHARAVAVRPAQPGSSQGFACSPRAELVAQRDRFRTDVACMWNGCRGARRHLGVKVSSRRMRARTTAPAVSGLRRGGASTRSTQQAPIMGRGNHWPHARTDLGTWSS